ncbi:MAG: beta-glucuronidase [Porphyromonadaceae bacterium]|nr:beta-glucuronidase [Porphyromonadaceae bacterium]
MLKKHLLFTLLFLTSLSFSQNKIIDISGKWSFEIDRNDVGVTEKWYSKQLVDNIYLPGSMAENRKGDDVTLNTQWTASIYDSTFFFNPRLAKFRKPENLKLPFWLTPVKYYVGPAWYQKEVTIPADWKNSRVVLFLERPHTETRLWINNREVGMQNSLSVPHQFDISNFLKKGKNKITLCIDNRTKEIDVGKDSHSITDQTQGNWNGVVGKMELRASPKTYIEDIQVYPDLKHKKAAVKLNIIGSGTGVISLTAESYNSDKSHTVSVSKPFKSNDSSLSVEVDLPMGNDFLTWDEFNPNLYKLTATLQTKEGTDTRETRFGMREITIDGKYFFVNGRKTMMRGTVENCVFPLTGYAPMDVESWERVFRICRNFGLNHMRFHSYCPPEAAMEAADLVGFYLQPEGPTWPNHGSSLGDGRPVDNYLWEEAQKIVKQYGNYPSFTMFAIGNEPRGRWVAWVSKFVNYWKDKDPRRVYTGASVGGSWAWQPANQFHVKAGARGLDWGRRPESYSNFLNRIDTVRQPFVSHETGQWCVFPDFTEIKKYTGVMRARNFELFREDLNDRGMGDQATDFMMASGKLQALSYKHEIERTFRTPGYAGFQLLSLNDYSGQGTALVGLLNAFWEEKGYINAEEFRKFCSPTVLLSKMDRFVFKNNETFKAEIEISHFGKNILKNKQTEWTIKDKYGKLIAKGNLQPKDIQIGECQQLGEVTLPLGFAEKAGKYNFEIRLKETDTSNNWDFWIYPNTLPQVDTTAIYIAKNLDEKAVSVLKNGGSVLLQLAGKVTQGKDVVQHFAPVFWNTSWFKMRPPHTTGILINDFHPVFSDFPTDYYSNLQWWELANRADVMELADFPKAFRPIVQPIDTWFINRRLAMLFEAKVGEGKIIVTSADIDTDLEKRFVARQLRHSILKYMNSNLFLPESEVTLDVIDNLTKKRGEWLDMSITRDAPDELKPNIR